MGMDSTTQHRGFIVRCADAHVRHPEPFATRREAEQFAEWGHACLATHMVEEIAELEQRKPCPYGTCETAHHWLAGCVVTDAR